MEQTSRPVSLRLGRFFVPTLLVYVAAAFIWVFHYDIHDSIWFGIFCCAPILGLVVWIGSTARKRHKVEGERKGRA